MLDGGLLVFILRPKNENKIVISKGVYFLGDIQHSLLISVAKSFQSKASLDVK